jgi:hypothetical protein
MAQKLSLGSLCSLDQWPLYLSIIPRTGVVQELIANEAHSAELAGYEPSTTRVSGIIVLLYTHVYNNNKIINLYLTSWYGESLLSLPSHRLMIMYTTHSHTLPLHSVFYTHNAQAHMLIFTEGGNETFPVKYRTIPISVFT